jgi:sterol desaturase/sphingolipid hydroxylase (fatty acid hydroxylase superfamily)
VDPVHHNRNFADALPIFDIVFGTYHRPAPEEFPTTGLGEEYRAPRSIWSAQVGPVRDAARVLLAKRSEERETTVR